MIVLGVDTSSSRSNVAIIRDEDVLEEQRSDAVSFVLKDIDKILKLTNLKLKDLDVLAGTIGPGSFTSLRIGLSIIKSISFALGIPWVGISTLDALAYNVFHRNKLYVCPILDAKKFKVFFCLYKREDFAYKYKKIIEDRLVLIEDLLSILEDKKEDIIVVGEGVSIYRDYLKKVDSEDVRFCAVAVAKLARIAYLEKKFYKEPTAKGCNYIKLSDAELKLSLLVKNE